MRRPMTIFAPRLAMWTAIGCSVLLVSAQAIAESVDADAELSETLQQEASVPPASAPPPSAPPRKVPRQEEDARAWEAYADAQGGLARLKYLPIGQAGHLSLGADARLRVNATANAGWQPAEMSPQVLERWMLHADAGMGDHLRVFGQLHAAYIQNTDRPGPIDADTLAAHQLFLELRELPLGEASLSVRAGRQEVSRGRQITLRHGPNMRLSFDGAHAAVTHKRWRFEVMSLRPVAINPGIFDNRSSSSDQLAGGTLRYAPKVAGGELSVSAIYLNRQRAEARYHAPGGEELRHAPGMTLDARLGPVDLNAEGILQVGQIEERDIFAYRLSVEAGLSLAELPMSPRLFVLADASSGDDAQTDRLETYDPFFPKGSYFAEFSAYGTSNLQALVPGVQLKPLRGLETRASVGYFRRASAGDGLYSPSLAPTIAPDAAVDARELGWMWALEASWQPASWISTTLGYAQHSAGAFPQALGRTEPIRFMTGWVELRL